MTTATTPDLRSLALGYLAGGLSIVPCSPQTKRPEAALLPVDDAGRASWKPYQTIRADAETVSGWFKKGCQSVGAVGGAISGGLLMLDFDADADRFYSAWSAAVGALADNLPVQRTGGGGIQVWLRCPEPGGNDKLAWSIDESEETGRAIAIETRAEGGYAIAPGSMHPTGNRYIAISGDFANIPTVPQAQADALLAAARKLDEAPLTKQQMEARERAAKVSNSFRASANGQGSVIDAYNEHVAIEQALESHGYARLGERWKRPGGNSPSVVVREGRAFHHSSDDPLNDGYWHRPFDLYCTLQHGGDVKAAVRAAAEQLGLNPAPKTAKSGDSNHTNAVKPAKTRIVCHVSRYAPPPLDTLPTAVRAFVIAAAQSVGCDVAYVLLPLLSILGAAIGTSCRIRIKSGTPGWTEPPILWTGSIGESGTGKTPASNEAMSLLDQREREAAIQYAEDVAFYEQTKLVHDAELASWKRRKDGSRGDPPALPEPPVCRRYVVSDITIESLAEKLSENPRGLTSHCEELASWFSSLTRYKASSQCSDVPQWLSIYSGGAIRVDRRTGIKKSLYVPSAFVAITGGIQPQILRQALSKEYFASGLPARFLLAMPPRQPRQWRDHTVPEITRLTMGMVFDRLCGIEHVVTDGHARPNDIAMTPEAKNLFIKFVNENGNEQYETTTGDLASLWSKLEATVARLALIFHLVRWASEDGVDFGSVDEVDIESGIRLTRWFGAEARRIYAILSESEEDQSRRELVELIDRLGGSVTVRDLMTSARAKYPLSGMAESALSDLVEHGVGSWRCDDHDGGRGRPASVFVLSANTQHTNSGNAEKTPIVCQDGGVLASVAGLSEFAEFSGASEE